MPLTRILAETRYARLSEVPLGASDQASAHHAIERDVNARMDAGDVAGAATAALRGLGPEIYGLLRALHRQGDAAEDVFSVFSEHLWRGLPSFAWQCSLRTWAYTLARNASRMHLRGARRRRDGVPLEPSVAEQIAQEVRTATKTWMRTETKDQFALLREALPDDDQMLLVLRVDRGLEWSELARVLGDAEAPSAEDIKRESAKLRKRYQVVKDRLMETAKRKGLLPKSSR